jgi:hypothetical protein
VEEEVEEEGEEGAKKGRKGRKKKEPAAKAPRKKKKKAGDDDDGEAASASAAAAGEELLADAGPEGAGLASMTDGAAAAAEGPSGQHQHQQGQQQEAGARRLPRLAAVVEEWQEVLDEAGLWPLLGPLGRLAAKWPALLVAPPPGGKAEMLGRLGRLRELLKVDEAGLAQLVASAPQVRHACWAQRCLAGGGGCWATLVGWGGREGMRACWLLASCLPGMALAGAKEVCSGGGEWGGVWRADNGHVWGWGAASRALCVW